MIKRLLNWRVLLALVGIAIVIGTVVYANYLSKQLAKEEQQKIELWVEAKKTEILSEDVNTLNLTTLITTTNTQLPIIWATEQDSIISFINLDTNKVKSNKNYVANQLADFKKTYDPIIYINPLDSTQRDKLYYGPSSLSKQLKWYPIIQILIVALFIIITLIALQNRNKATQNQVWAGMAKETAHQLGTPLNSLAGWLEVLKTQNLDPNITEEIGKDVERISLVSDRFSKIGSSPKLEPYDIVGAITNMAEYMRKRAPGKISINVHSTQSEIFVPVSVQLWDWVMENLIKNALDAMEGKGSIDITIIDQKTELLIDVVDTGKGIPREKWQTVFKPGFTTKKRGWGLGLSLTKRIVEEYHGGKIWVKQSEQKRGTTFAIILPKG